MSSDRSQKIFDATPARKAKARRDGNVARSAELSAIASFGGAALTTFATIGPLGAAAAAALVALCGHPSLASIPGALPLVLALGLLPALAAAVAGGGASLLQAGGLRVNVPKWQLSRLNPIAGLKRMVGGEAIVGAIRAVVAFGVAALALWPLAGEIFARSTTVGGAGAFGLLVADGARRACVATLAVGACFAIADLALVRRRWLRELKMTFEEMRRDQKENDGDPQARSRRKTLHRTLIEGSLTRVKDASFVVVNPTHIAIAIVYAPPQIPVPQVLVRAADDGAATVKRLAAEHHIPIVEDVALARALYAQAESGRAIPSQTFIAVAHVIAELLHTGAIT